MPGPTDPPSPAAARPPTAVDGTVVVAGDGPLARHLHDGLTGLGLEVETTLAGHGSVAAAVFAPWDPATIVPVALHDLTDEQFHAAWQQTMDDAVALCVGARERFDGRGGR